MNLTPKKIDQKGSGLIASLLSLFFGIIISIVALRFVFLLIGVNASQGFVNWIYSASQPLVNPFIGIFGSDINIFSGVIEIGTAIALLVYTVVASIIIGLFSHSGHARAI